jgi:hypothetical protein
MASLSIVTTYDAPGNGPAGLAWDGRVLWNADFTAGRLFAVDPWSGETVRSLVCPGNLSGLAWDGRSLWQSLYQEGMLRRINPESNDFDQTLSLVERGWLSGVAWDGRYLWTVAQQRGELLAVERESGRVVQTLPAPVVGGGLAYDEGYLWLSVAYPMAFDETYQQFDWQGEERLFAVVQLDPENGRELARYDAQHLYMGVAWVNGELWLSHAGERKLYRGRITP